jgi:hypothetical protein
MVKSISTTFALIERLRAGEGIHVRFLFSIFIFLSTTKGVYIA